MLRASWHSWLSSESPRVGPLWLYWAWTLLFCAVLALGFTLLGFVMFARSLDDWISAANWRVWYSRNLTVCVTIGVIIHLLSDLMRWLRIVPQRTRRWRPWQRSMFFSGVPMVGVVIGWPLGMWFTGAMLLKGPVRANAASTIIGSVLFALALSALFHHFFATRRRQLDAERRATEAQLRLLQGQIEPHFLFNTLANVQSLIDHDAPRAKQMLESFTDYLRSSLGSLRLQDNTLGAELDLAQAYLTLLKTRMEDRLEFSIDADASLRETRMPPLLLQPLVENAIHHGLEPKVEGGRIQVSARRDGATLVLQVVDDGIGLHSGAAKRRGAGVALNNLRARLEAQFPGASGLELRDARPGTLATLRLPLQKAPSP